MQSDYEGNAPAEEIEVDMSPEEYQDHLQSLIDKHDQLEEEIDEDVKELETLLLKRNPLSIISNLWLRNSITDPDSYKEYEHEGNDAYTEYVATFYLTEEFDLGEGKGIEPIQPQVLEQIQIHAERIFTNTILNHGLRDVDASDPQPPSPSSAPAKWQQ